MSARDWDAFVATHPAGHLFQTEGWSRVKAAFGWECEHVAGEQSAAQILYKPLPLRLGTVAYLPRGPVVDWRDELAASHLLADVEAAARRRHAWALWLEPEWPDLPEVRARLRAWGWQPVSGVIQPPRTIHIDLSPSEDAILARMKQKTRYNIRLAARRGVTVREGTLADFPTFYRLMLETGHRDGFGVRRERYYRLVLEMLLETDRGALLLAEIAGEPVGAILVASLGRKSWYLYGASSSQHRRAMPTYALQWTAIRWAKDRGCDLYDMWGIPDADEQALEVNFTQRSDGLWGVYRFKRGFGGRVVRYVGLWNKSLHPLDTLLEWWTWRRK